MTAAISALTVRVQHFYTSVVPKAMQPQIISSLRQHSNINVDVELVFDQPRVCTVMQAKMTPSDAVHDAAGFADAMASALVGGDYGTYGYSCAGAIGFGSTGSWTNAFANVSQHGSSCISCDCSQ